MSVVWNITWFSDSADGSDRRGTRLGVIDDRTAIEKPPNPADEPRSEVHDRERRVVDEGAREQHAGGERLTALRDEQQPPAVVACRSADRRGPRRAPAA